MWIQTTKTLLVEFCLCYINTDYCTAEKLALRCEFTHACARTHTHLQKKQHDPLPEQTVQHGSNKVPIVRTHTQCVIKVGAFLWRCLCVDCQHDLDTPPPSQMCTYKQETGHTHDFMYRGTRINTHPTRSSAPLNSVCTKPVVMT